MTALNEDLLSQYFDGELADEEAEVVRRALEEDDALRAKLEGLEHLSALIGSVGEMPADAIDSDALFASIEAKLEADVADDEPMFPRAAPADEADEAADGPAHESPRPKLAVVPGGKKESERRDAPAARPSRAGLWVGVGATLAAAAALLLWVMQPGDGTQPMVDDGSGSTLAEAPPPGSEVEEVDFGYNTGAIFSVEGTEGEQYAVVWISDEKPILDEESEERVQ